VTPDQPDSAGPLTAFQVRVARAFFAQPDAAGFLLAGGAALAAHGLTERPTQDLDLFTAPGIGEVHDALSALESAAETQGWTVRRVRVAETFVRVLVAAAAEATAESVLVDLAVDARPERAPSMSIAGPTLDPEDLAGRKVVALFDRAEARDFADVQALADRYGTDRLLELAAAVDAGFDVAVFADMLDSLARFSDAEIPAEDPSALRVFASQWADTLRRRSTGPEAPT
jgi:predicted nucleotidyltransferase component of viral defense system